MLLLIFLFRCNCIVVTFQICHAVAIFCAWPAMPIDPLPKVRMLRSASSSLIESTE